MAPPRKAARGRTRRRVKKNIAIGQAHIKTSFNNTIVSLTDKDGAVIVWESAGSAGFKGSRKSTPFAAQVTADAPPARAWSTASRRSRSSSRGLAPAARPRSGRSRPPASRSSVSRDVTPQAHNGVRQKKRRRV